MNTKHLTIAGPYTHENLSIFLLLGADALDGQRFIPLDDTRDHAFNDAVLHCNLVTK